MWRPSVSVVMPMFNEEENIAHAIATTAEALEVHASAYEIVVVDDASTDRSPEIVRAIARRDPRVRLLRNARNRKLGGTLRAGFAATRMELVLYMDADLPFDPFEIGRAIRAMHLTGADMIAAYRQDRTGEGLVRAAYSYAYNALIGVLFGFPHRDVNFAFKLMRRRLLEAVTLRSEGSLISAELLVKARKLGFRIQQIGVDYFPRTRGRSTLASVGVIGTILRELVALQGEMRAAGAPHAANAPRVAAWTALAVFLVTLASRIPFATEMLWSHDSVLYARALEQGFQVGFDLSQQRPHAPGYIFYVGLAEAARRLVGDVNGALVLISMLASAAGAAVLYLFARRFARAQVALLVALAYAAAPLVWTYSEVAYPYTLLALLSLALAWLIRARGAGVATGLAFGAAAGFRQDLLLVLGPLWLFALRERSWRGRGTALVALGAGCLAWLVPSAAMSGGLEAYASAVVRQGGSVAAGTSAVTQGPAGLAFNASLAGASLGWGLFGVLPVGALLAMLGTRQVLARRRVEPGAEPVFFALWALPGLAALVLVHIGEPGHVLGVLPALYVAIAAGLDRALRAAPPLARVPVFAAAAAVIVLVPAVAFMTGGERFSAAALERHDRALAARIAYVRSTFSSATTAILAREDFLLVRHYLPEYRIWYHDPEPFTRQAVRWKRTTRLAALVVFTDGLRARQPTQVRRVDLGGGISLSYVPIQVGSVLELEGERYSVRGPGAEESLLTLPRSR